MSGRRFPSSLRERINAQKTTGRQKDKAQDRSAFRIAPPGRSEVCFLPGDRERPFRSSLQLVRLPGVPRPGGSEDCRTGGGVRVLPGVGNTTVHHELPSLFGVWGEGVGHRCRPLKRVPHLRRERGLSPTPSSGPLPHMPGPGESTQERNVSHGLRGDATATKHDRYPCRRGRPNPGQGAGHKR